MSLRVLNISTFDSGGAATAAYRLHKGLLDSNIESCFYVLHNKKNQDVFSFFKNPLASFTSRSLNKLREMVITSDKNYYFYGAWNNSVTDISQIDLEFSEAPNVIILHWISGFVSLDVILALKKKYDAKIFWYLMDMAPMTGGCHYAWDCAGYTNDCSNCPAIKTIFNNMPKRELQRRMQLVKEMGVEIISPTSWLSQQAKKSSLFKTSVINEVLLGIDENVFKPLDTYNIDLLKEKYNICKSKRIIAFGTQNFSEKRKGSKYLLRAIEKLTNSSNFDVNNCVLVTAGNLGGHDFTSDLEHVHLGYLGSELELASFYQIADVLISPSIEDSGPMMVNESFMCGTPVVAFNMGVAMDLIIQNETGYIAKLKDSNAIALGIEAILGLDRQSYKDMRIKCREIGLEKLSFTKQIKKLYDVLNK